MTTHIREIHNEQFSDGRYTIGIVLNENDDRTWKESFAYVYEHGRNMYTFYETIFDMLNFLLYREDKQKRAYMPDEEFEGYCDAQYIEDTFSSHLSWV